MILNSMEKGLLNLSVKRLNEKLTSSPSCPPWCCLGQLQCVCKFYFYSLLLPLWLSSLNAHVIFSNIACRGILTIHDELFYIINNRISFLFFCMCNMHSVYIHFIRQQLFLILLLYIDNRDIYICIFYIMS